jgi:addiction module RelE/StbE family toxin
VTRILWSPRALRDLDSLHAYIAQDSELYAELVIQRILVSVERLVEFPESGRVVPERNDRNLREVIVRPYRIVYRLRPGSVEIATIFRASRLFQAGTE